MGVGCAAAGYESLSRELQGAKGNAQVCATTVGLSQTLLLADHGAMNHILDAIRKIRAYSAELAKKE